MLAVSVARAGVLAADDRLDDAVVAVVPPIKDGKVLGLGVDEHEEAVAEILHLRDGVLHEHRLDREALRLHHASLACRFGGPVGDPAENLFLLDGSGTEARLALVVDRSSLDLVDDDVEARLE